MIENIVPVHRNKSKEVRSDNLDRALRDAAIMQDMMREKRFIGKHDGAFALHHSQVTDKPLNFFVFDETVDMRLEGELIVLNPSFRGDLEPVWKKEGCMSLIFEKKRRVKRYETIIAQFAIARVGFFQQTLTGLIAEVFQHEVDHANAKYIYD